MTLNPRPHVIADLWHAIPDPVRARAWHLSEFLWTRTPRMMRRTSLMRSLGRRIHRRVRSNRRFESFATRFRRNRPQIELLAHLCDARPAHDLVRIASLGCSTGAEVYSLLHAIRSLRGDLVIDALGVDFSRAAIAKAEQAVYSFWDPELKGLSEREMDALFFDRAGFKVVREHLLEGVSWLAADIRDPAQLEALGPRDIVLVNNVLIHLPPTTAELVLWRILDTVAPQGFLVLSGVDLNLKERIMRGSGFVPIRERLREVHLGDQGLLDDWPWRYWGLEPMDTSRPDWRYRYSTVFRSPD